MTTLDLGTLKGHVDLDIDLFDRKYGQVRAALRQLAAESPELLVGADVTGALGDLDRVSTAARSVPNADLAVTADTSGAESALDDIGGKAKRAGADAGADAGQGLAGGIIAALATIPVAGAIVGIGAAVGDAILDGLAIEAGRDLFSARTGLDEATSARFARAAGEAYANAWGDSVEGNLATAREALRAGLLDPSATQQDAQAVIAQLSGVADVLETDIPTAARAAGQMVRTGLVADGTAALDLLVVGARRVETTAGDLVEVFGDGAATINQFGLDGRTALGLFKQAADAGAPSADFLVGALEELAGNAGDSIDVFERLGLSGEDMASRLTGGGERAAEGLGMLLQALRDTEDPAARTTALVGLFGEEATAMQEALLALDPTNAVATLGAVEGAAQSALDTMGDNAAAQIESARRNIEVAADGIKGALAAAFADEATDAAQWVQRNRGPMMEFLLDTINGALDLGTSFVEGLAAAGGGVGSFLSGPIADLLDGMGSVVRSMEWMPGDQRSIYTSIEETAAAARRAGDTLEGASDNMGTEWAAALADVKDQVNDWAAPEILAAHIHDAVFDAQSRLDELSATINSTGGTVTINGNQVAAQEALDAIVANIDEADGTVTINGNRVPAGEALNTLMGLVESSQGDVTIGGDSATARGAVEGFKVWSTAQKAWVPVDADTGPASAAVSAWVARENERGRSIRIQTIIEAGGNTGHGFSGGGFTGHGGKYEPAGIVHRGEFVIDAEETAEHRPLLEAIHAGRDIPGYDDGGYVTAAAAAAARFGQYLPAGPLASAAPAAVAPGGITGPLVIEGTLDLGDGLVGKMRGIACTEAVQVTRLALSGRPTR